MNTAESHITNCIPDGYCDIGKDAKLSEESLANLLKKMSEVELSESLKDSINSHLAKSYQQRLQSAARLYDKESNSFKLTLESFFKFCKKVESLLFQHHCN